MHVCMYVFIYINKERDRNETKDERWAGARSTYPPQLSEQVIVDGVAAAEEDIFDVVA